MSGWSVLHGNGRHLHIPTDRRSCFKIVDGRMRTGEAIRRGEQPSRTYWSRRGGNRSLRRGHRQEERKEKQNADSEEARHDGLARLGVKGVPGYLSGYSGIRVFRYRLGGEDQNRTARQSRRKRKRINSVKADF